MITYKDLLLITGSGIKVKIGYDNMSGFIYEGELKDAPAIEADAEVVNQYVYEGEDALTIVLKK